MLAEAPAPQEKSKRARSAKDKEQKRELILTTAAQLFDLDPDLLPTAAAIANHSGIAKGTVYLYFKSKEEIFLALLEQHYKNWYADITGAITEDKPDADHIIQALCHYVEQQPQFFRLASLSHSVIEQNVDKDILIAFKNRMAQMVQVTGQELAKKLEIEDDETCSQLLVRSYAMLLGLWQISTPPEKLAEILSSPNLTVLQPEFSMEAKQSLAQLWVGYLEQNTSKGGGFWKLGKLFN
ncbi:TetR/AcrR family transcriptional regulator [Saccharobesus litoralis]|uniref:TetR/AcrR family transcriptional regulator n=1 Tax=Saccharobesus litoralis TaxID=2172099 RepID=A0A2S0VLL9_9ALTE|nr:TetR/AcrR family transcriptional regulator [Saccharobesus litoralis]AWB65010.1 TetR/AcrR family transcriptional regulator [Saccharobesus litoralis]